MTEQTGGRRCESPVSTVFLSAVRPPKNPASQLIARCFIASANVRITEGILPSVGRLLLLLFFSHAIGTFLTCLSSLRVCLRVNREDASAHPLPSLLCPDIPLRVSPSRVVQQEPSAGPVADLERSKFVRELLPFSRASSGKIDASGVPDSIRRAGSERPLGVALLLVRARGLSDRRACECMYVW